MSLYNAMKFDVTDAPSEPRNRFDDLADALRSLPEGKFVRVAYDPEMQRANQKAAIRTALTSRGILIETFNHDDGMYLRVKHLITPAASPDSKESSTTGVAND